MAEITTTRVVEGDQVYAEVRQTYDPVTTTQSPTVTRYTSDTIAQFRQDALDKKAGAAAVDAAQDTMLVKLDELQAVIDDE